MFSASGGRAAALPIASRMARAEAYPIRAMHWLVGFAGGSNDSVARMISQAGDAARKTGGLPMPMTPPDFGKLIADETEKWRKVVEFDGCRGQWQRPSLKGRHVR
jgi:hypothetical protein